MVGPYPIGEDTKELAAEFTCVGHSIAHAFPRAHIKKAAAEHSKAPLERPLSGRRKQLPLNLRDQRGQGPTGVDAIAYCARQAGTEEIARHAQAKEELSSTAARR